MDLVSDLATVESNDAIHESRLLVLLRSFIDSDANTVDGLTKLAKLDFLLRYPTYLEQAIAKKASAAAAKTVAVEDYERSSVESSMVRYRYGPWDFRYRRLLNLLIGKGLAFVRVDGRTIKIGLTEDGIAKADVIRESAEFEHTVARADLLRKYFDVGATTLMKFIYATFPAIGSLRLGDEIR